MALARRLCRLPRLLPLAAATKPYLPHLLGNPSSAPLLPSFSTPSLPPAPSLPSLFSTTASSSSSSGDSSMVVVGSAESFTSILSNVEAEKLPAVFYYTAVWCGPCRAMAPVIAKLSSWYPKIPIYKVDIDMPTFHFYYQGRKTDEVVGVDVTKLGATMESLHDYRSFVEEYDREVAKCLHALHKVRKACYF